MKKLALLSVFIFLTFASFCQLKFELTPKGFVSTTDTSKEYIVIEVSGKSKADLFKKLELYVNKTFVSPKDVISKVDNESITLNGYAERAIRRNGMHVFNMNYTINFEFKDGKIKVSSPTFRLTTYTTKKQNLWLVSNNSFDGSDLGIYNTKYKLKSDMAKEDLEKYFDNFISKLSSYLQKENVDW
jgi:hypothetical protein